MKAATRACPSGSAVDIRMLILRRLPGACASPRTGQVTTALPKLTIKSRRLIDRSLAFGMCGLAGCEWLGGTARTKMRQPPTNRSTVLTILGSKLMGEAALLVEHDKQVETDTDADGVKKHLC